MILSPPARAGERPVATSFRYLPPAATAVAALEPGSCRWPLGRTGEVGFAFCGAPRRRPGSYCATHAGLARAGAANRGGRP